MPNGTYADSQWSYPGGTRRYQPWGAPEYTQALADWQRDYGTYAQMMGQVQPALGQMMGYYRPGGGYGAGRRREAEETVKGGMARDIGQMVSAGMASQFGARGAGTRGGAELSRLYKNIEDTRSQLWQQSIQPYAQMMSQMAQMQQARPAYREYITPGYGRWEPMGGKR